MNNVDRLYKVFKQLSVCGVCVCAFEEESKTSHRTIICYFVVDFSGDLGVPEM